MSCEEEAILDQLDIGETDFKNHDDLLRSFGIVDSSDKITADKPSKQRTEPSQDVSIFPLVEKTDSVDSAQLLSGLKNTASLDALKHQVNHIEKSRKQLKPSLPQVVSDRIERHAAYDATTKDISKWESVITKNRNAEQLKFPLKEDDYSLDSGTAMDEFVGGFKPRTPLEKQIFEMLNGSKFVERKNHDLSLAEEEALKSLSFEEAKIRREELQKHRALMSYHEAKNKRRNKIKSKSYKRIQRKQKEKKEISQMEKLEKEDPESAAKLMKKAEILRAEERAGQRHKQGSKWARNRRLIGKYDELSRLQLNEQNKLHKELTTKSAAVENVQKTKQENISMVAPTADIQHYDVARGNPWLRHEPIEKVTEAAPEKVDLKHALPSAVINEISSNEESDEESDLKNELMNIKETIEVQKKADNTDAFRTAYAKLCVEESQLNEVERLNDSSPETQECDDNPNETEEILDVSMTRIKTLQDADEILKQNVEDRKVHKKSEDKTKAKQTVVHKYIDPKKVFTLPTQSTAGDDAQDKNQMTLKDAFTDDDVVNTFIEEKQNITEKMIPKLEDTRLPGWGNWGGVGIVPKPLKKKKTKAVVKPQRKDDNLGHVIINENQVSSVAKYQVNDVPYPFVNKTQFEQTIRQPIGSTWNTPSTVKKLTQPQIVTKLGAIIEPMSRDQAVPTKTKSLNTKPKTGKKKPSKKRKLN